MRCIPVVATNVIMSGKIYQGSCKTPKAERFHLAEFSAIFYKTTSLIEIETQKNYYLYIVVQMRNCYDSKTFFGTL